MLVLEAKTPNRNPGVSCPIGWAKSLWRIDLGDPVLPDSLCEALLGSIIPQRRKISDASETEI